MNTAATALDTRRLESKLESRLEALKSSYFERKLNNINHGVVRLIKSKEFQMYLKNRKDK